MITVNEARTDLGMPVIGRRCICNKESMLNQIARLREENQMLREILEMDDDDVYVGFDLAGDMDLNTVSINYN